MLSNVKENTPFFSICIPAYNVEKYIEECIQSVLAQDYSDFEVIIVNDGSTDNSGNIADAYARKDPRISVIHQENIGLFHTRIRAFAQATGKYVICLDSDDYYESFALSSIVKCVEKSDADIVIFDYCTQYENGKRIISELAFADGHTWANDKLELLRLFVFTSKINTIWRKAIKKELIKWDGFEEFPKIRMWEDWIHSFYPIKDATRIVYLKKAIINYRVLASSMTASFDAKINRTINITNELSKKLLVKYPMLGEDEVEKQYIRHLAKAVVYIPGIARDKKAYLQMIEEIRDNQLVRELWAKHKRKLEFVYRLPIALLFADKDKTLYNLKSIIGKIRRR